jgi:transketolase
LALGHRLNGAHGRVLCLTSDGDWNEGSTWESLIFARHQNLDNLAVIVDQCDCRSERFAGFWEDVGSC